MGDWESGEKGDRESQPVSKVKTRLTFVEKPFKESV